MNILQGDALTVLRTLPAESVNCCVTSPPYWGLRDYGTGEWEGGLPDCDHTYNHGVQGSTGQRADRTFTAQAVYRGVCRKCGATRVDRQLGLEKTPEEYVGRLSEVFLEVRRVLKSDGTLWLNLGDSYNAYNGGTGPGSKLSKTQTEQRPQLETGYGLQCKTLKPKDLIGIPWRVAFALQADGWWLRSDIIWHKPNPMPESVTDRPTKAHEYIFLMAKSARYYYDADSIRQPHSEVSLARARRNRFGGKYIGSDPAEHGALKSGNGYGPDGDPDIVCSPAGRNRRTVWTVSTCPTPEAHFATYPPDLIEPCILAGCPAGGTVLDPFAGAGTTGLACLKHGRKFLGIELNPAYIEIAATRGERIMPLLAGASDFYSTSSSVSPNDGTPINIEAAR